MSADYTAWRITYQSSEQAAQAAYRAAQQHLARCVELEAERDRLDGSLRAEVATNEDTLEQRDHAEDMADKLAHAIAGITGRDIGEHSSANCPWHAAMEYAEEYQSERDALADALRPFAQAWERRMPMGPVDTTGYKRRLARALLPFYSHGSADGHELTGQHLKDAHDALEQIAGQQAGEGE